MRIDWTRLLALTAVGLSSGVVAQGGGPTIKCRVRVPKELPLGGKDRMRDIFVSVSVLVLLCTSTASAKKERQWQTGKLLDMKQVNVTFLGRDVIMPGTVGAVARSRINETYLIDAGEYIYASQEVRRSQDKTPPLTVNGPVQFAIEKDHVYIKDEDGKEHDTMLIKKTLKGFA